MTALHSCLPEHVVPTATAQAATAIQQAASLVAGPATRAWGAHAGVSLTEIRRLLKVNQLSGEAAGTQAGLEGSGVAVVGINEDGPAQSLL